MLSAVENFGPVGPSAALPYATQHSNTYAITAAAAAASAALLTPTHLTHLNALQTQYSEHQQQQQHLQQHQFQHQQQKELNQRLQYGLFLTPPPITSVASYSSAAAASKPLTSKCSPQYNELSHLQHIKVQQKSSLPYTHRSARETTPPNQSNSLSLPEESKSIMSINEFTRPHPKHQRHHNAAIRINSIPPQQQNNLSLNLNGYHNPTNYSTTTSNDQSGPMNLVTTSSAYANIHDNSRSSSSSSSVDIENDGSMSPSPVHSIPIQNRKSSDSTLGHSKLPHDPNDHSQQQQQNSAAIAATVAAASYQFNYTQLYASTAALYGAPVIFSSNHPAMVSSHGSGMRALNAPYLNALSTHHPTQPQSSNAIAYSAAYLKAIQNAAAAAGLPFNTAVQQQAPPTLSSPSGNHCRPTMHHNHTGSMSALAPPPPPGPAIVSNNHTSSLSSSNDLRHKSQSELKMDNNRICQPALPPPNTKLSTSGTYLNDKVNAESTDADNFFKVPSGKEGSLKHRILTRPSSSDKSEAIRNSAVMRTHNSTSNFRKGSYIELSNGNVRRVEDMRTEDFIQCAERSPHHQLTESTVVKISTAPPYTMVITFSYDKNRSKADIEVSAEHPFFVYGQGWASCNPEASLKAFGLKCQYLQVGDICISLTQRESKITHLAEAESNSSATSNQTNPSSHDDNQVSQNLIRQPLSEKRLAPVAITQYPVVHNNIPLHMLPSHLSTNYSYANIAETVAAYNTQRDLALSPKVLSNFYQQPPQQHLFHPAAIHQGDAMAHELKNTNPLPMHLPRPSSIHSVQQRYYEMSLLPSEVDQSHSRNDSNGNSIDVKSVASDEQNHDQDQDQDQPVDASTKSRKRRWSAPESICDETECQPTCATVRQPHMSDGQVASRLSTYKTFVTSSSGSNDNLSI